LAASIFTSQVQAAERERLLLAYTFIEMSGQAKVMTDLGTDMIKPYLDQLKKQSKKPVVAETFAIIFNEELEAAEEELKWKMAKLYARNLTETELRAIVRFYKSPAGLSLQAKGPILEAEGGKMGEKWMQEILIRSLERLQAAYGVNIR